MFYCVQLTTCLENKVHDMICLQPQMITLSCRFGEPELGRAQKPVDNHVILSELVIHIFVIRSLNQCKITKITSVSQS